MIDNSMFCPECRGLDCSCPPPWWAEAQAEDAYVRGYDRGQADGPENRPSERWLRAPYNSHREAEWEGYLAGYDDGAAGRPCRYRDSRLTEYDEEPEALGFLPIPPEEVYPLPR